MPNTSPEIEGVRGLAIHIVSEQGKIVFSSNFQIELKKENNTPSRSLIVYSYFARKIPQMRVKPNLNNINMSLTEFSIKKVPNRIYFYITYTHGIF